jgi:hypothetical protein
VFRCIRLYIRTTGQGEWGGSKSHSRSTQKAAAMKIDFDVTHNTFPLILFLCFAAQRLFLSRAGRNACESFCPGTLLDPPVEKAPTMIKGPNG